MSPARGTETRQSRSAAKAAAAAKNPPPEDPPAASTSNGTPAQTNTAVDDGEPMIDPELADLPAPPHHNGPDPSEEGRVSITESIAQAPNPRPADFSMLPLQNEDIDLSALDAATVDGPPGSPTARLLKAIAPPNAAQPDPKWPPVSIPSRSVHFVEPVPCSGGRYPNHSFTTTPTVALPHCHPPLLHSSGHY